MSNQEEREPGVYWRKDPAGKWQIQRDRLATLEEWALNNPDRMNPKRYEQLTNARLEYQRVIGLILQHIDREPSGLLVVEQFDALAKEWGLKSSQTIEDVAKRLERDKRLVYDFAGPSAGGTWWHWYETPSSTDQANSPEALQEDDNVEERVGRRNGSDWGSVGEGRTDAVNTDGAGGVGATAGLGDIL